MTSDEQGDGGQPPPRPGPLVDDPPDARSLGLLQAALLRLLLVDLRLRDRDLPLRDGLATALAESLELLLGRQVGITQHRRTGLCPGEARLEGVQRLLCRLSGTLLEVARVGDEWQVLDKLAEATALVTFLELLLDLGPLVRHLVAQLVDLGVDRALQRRDLLALRLGELVREPLEVPLELRSFGSHLLQPLAVGHGLLDRGDRRLDEQEAEEQGQDDREQRARLPQDEAEDCRDQTHRAILVPRQAGRGRLSPAAPRTRRGGSSGRGRRPGSR